MKLIFSLFLCIFFMHSSCYACCEMTSPTQEDIENYLLQKKKEYENKDIESFVIRDTLPINESQFNHIHYISRILVYDECLYFINPNKYPFPYD